MQFYLRKDDFMLINGAIDFGDILKTMPEASEKDIENIEKLQSILRNLSEVPPNIFSSYGFRIINKDSNFVGANRGWHVSIDTFKHNSLVISSFYNDMKDRDEDLEMSMEYSFQFGGYDDYFAFNSKYYLEWIKEVSDPNQYRNKEQYFELETEFCIKNN